MKTIVLDEPLGVPKGTVRGVLALALIASAILFLYLGIDIPEWYRALVVMFAGYYAGSRATG